MSQGTQPPTESRAAERKAERDARCYVTFAGVIESLGRHTQRERERILGHALRYVAENPVRLSDVCDCLPGEGCPVCAKVG